VRCEVRPCHLLQHCRRRLRRCLRGADSDSVRFGSSRLFHTLGLVELMGGERCGRAEVMHETNGGAGACETRCGDAVFKEKNEVVVGGGYF
jgi:hypothetical protein